jgi:hypothetical protein
VSSILADIEIGSAKTGVVLKNNLYQLISYNYEQQGDTNK